MKVRDENGPSSAFHLMEVPMVDLTMSHPDVELGSMYSLHRSTAGQVAGAYVGESAQDAAHVATSDVGPHCSGG
ncbi:hypothetical protein [Paenarthrobacter sp. YIM B13468]|uniref:hypothetical protein n=1 Tax=Paenarthrobacter sp. YIM B13468 TaxID=3366295 RepID=UPI00366C3794